MYPDLSYTIVGVLFSVFNELGYGHREKYYQNAIAVILDNKGIKFKREVYTPLVLEAKKIGNYYLDFLIDEKVILEVKQGEHFAPAYIRQIYSYLVTNSKQLGILANFTPQGVKHRRIVNLINKN